MRDKAIAIYSTTLVILIAFFLFISIIVLMYWMGIQNKQATQVACGLKLTAYCADWLKSGYDSSSRPTWWDEKDPKNCNEVGIMEPSADDCKGKKTT
jgi:hypothetical protein